MPSFYVWTIGCQMNFADSWQLEQVLYRLGYDQAPRAEQADLVVLNTCVVRQHAENKCVGRLTSLKGWRLRKAHRILVVMGCFVGDMEQLRTTYDYVDLFCRPSAYMDVVHYLCDQDRDLHISPSFPKGQVPVSMHVPISYGCDHHCTYCIVRLRRGREQSRPIAEIVHEIEDLVERGVQEVTLLGQNVDSYGHDLPEIKGHDEHIHPPTLADLLYAVHEIAGLVRIRFLTSHPADMHDTAIRAVADLPRVCPHFELPFQAGDDTVLKRMARGYTIAQYKNLIARVQAYFPSQDGLPRCSIATDVIVGFPGETREQYQASYTLLQELSFDAVHVAAYSERPGTPAARLPDDVPQAEKERRRKAIDDLQGEIVGEINAVFMGRTAEILVERKRKGRWEGRTRTNKLVYFEDEDRDWSGKMAQVQITWTGPWSMIGTVSKQGEYE